MKGESASMARAGRRRGYAAAVSAHDGLADVQTQSAALEPTSSLSPVELTKHTRSVLGGEAHTPIGNVDPNGAVLHLHVHVDAAAIGAVLNSVCQQVLEDLPQALRIP